MRLLATALILQVLVACNQRDSNSTANVPAVPDSCVCENCVEVKDLVTFKPDDNPFPGPYFYSLLDFIRGQGMFTPSLNRQGNPDIQRATTKIFNNLIDTCNTNGYYHRDLQMDNMKISSIWLQASSGKAARVRGMWLEEWLFESNRDRDSAMGMVRKVYANPGNEGHYDKLYSHFMLADKRIIMIQMGVASAQDAGDRYRDLIEGFIKKGHAGLADADDIFRYIEYDSVELYDFEPTGGKGNRIVDSAGRPQQRILKQVKPDHATILGFNRRLQMRGSYGNGTASCFEPHMGVVYYLKGKPVMQVSICLACNRLSSTVDIPAQKQGAQGSGDDLYYIADGMSRSFRTYLNGLLKAYDFSNQVSVGNSLFNN